MTARSYQGGRASEMIEDIDPSLENWMLDALAVYRELGFFDSPKSHHSVAEWVARRHNSRFQPWAEDGETVRNLFESHPHLGLLYFDRRRTLDLDFESPSVSGDTMYQYELARLARICRGAFSPSNIEESLSAGRCA